MKNKIKVFGALVISSILCTSPIMLYAESKMDYKAIESKLMLLETLIEDQYLYNEDIINMENEIYKGYIRGLGDEYSEYLTAEEFSSLLLEMENKQSSVGLSIRSDDKNQVIVESVRKDYPAGKAGIKSGDIIYSVNGILLKGLNDTTISYFKGLPGTTMSLEIISGENKNLRKVELVRIEESVQVVQSEMVSKNIGYVYISEFTLKTSDEFATAIERLEKEGMEKLIIDVRENLGGDLNAAIKTLAYILPDKELLYTKDKSDKTMTFYSKEGQIILEQKPNIQNDESRIIIGEDKHQLNIPIVVLVNEYTASSAEILSGTLKDYERATLIGNQTYGKGVVQSIIKLKDGSAIKLTNSHYFTPSGKSIHNIGITPDIKVENTSNLENSDAQLEKAIEILEGK